jgi:quinoprotein glucose dehydrogenase
VRREDLIDFTPAIRAEAEKILKNYGYGEIYTPPATDRPTLVLPGWAGGPSWAGAAFDPESATLYVTSITSPTAVQVVPPQRGVSDHRFMGNVSPLVGPQGLPLLKPPTGG